MAYWVAHLQPGHARLALTLLGQFGYQVYYPLIPGKRSMAPAALFPNYAFVAAIERWWSANNCPGVRRLMRGNGERPTEIVDGIVDDIRRREGRDGLVKLPKARGLQPGDKVRIVRGALEGRLGVLHAGMNGHARVAVLLTMLGSERRVLLPRTDVKPIRHE